LSEAVERASMAAVVVSRDASFSGLRIAVNGEEDELANGSTGARG